MLVEYMSAHISVAVSWTTKQHTGSLVAVTVAKIVERIVVVESVEAEEDDGSTAKHEVRNQNSGA